MFKTEQPSIEKHYLDVLMLCPHFKQYVFVMFPHLPLQSAAEWFGSGKATFKELLSLLPLQKRHVECSEQENSKRIVGHFAQIILKPTYRPTVLQRD